MARTSVHTQLAIHVVLAMLILLFGFARPALAQELLVNGSFEDPVTPANGNNFYTTINGWTIVSISPAQSLPWNVIRAWSGYAGNPAVTPSGGGAQYLDINAASGTIRQTVTVPSRGMVDFSGWFSVRDVQQALTGLNIKIRDSGGTIVGTASTSFAASDPIGLWKQAAGFNVPVGPGIYSIEVDIPDFANFDVATLVFKPALTVNKTEAPYSDPVNGTTNPKLIPGSIAEYAITVTAPASYSVSSNSLALADATPTGSALIVADIGTSGSGPVGFAGGTSGLSYVFTSLASTTDAVDFSNDNGTTWSYTPVANALGADPAVTTVRIRPQGVMAASSSATVRLRYLVN